MSYEKEWMEKAEKSLFNNGYTFFRTKGCCLVRCIADVGRAGCQFRFLQDFIKAKNLRTQLHTGCTAAEEIGIYEDFNHSDGE